MTWCTDIDNRNGTSKVLDKSNKLVPVLFLLLLLMAQLRSPNFDARLPRKASAALSESPPLSYNTGVNVIKNSFVPQKTSRFGVSARHEVPLVLLLLPPPPLAVF